MIIGIDQSGGDPCPSALSARGRRGFTMLEMAISLAIICTLLAIMLPALQSMRVTSRREQSSDNLRRLHPVWQAWLNEHNDEFPYVPVQAGWQYGGVRFSALDDQPFLDPQRPLTPYLPVSAKSVDLFRSPADTGITDASGSLGTGRRTAYRAFGTSYYANPQLLVARFAGVENGDRGLRLSEIATVPSRLVLMGSPIWNEIREDTGRLAAWHGDDDRGLLLFLDGAVQYTRIRRKHESSPAVYEPKLKDARWLELERQAEQSDEVTAPE